MNRKGEIFPLCVLWLICGAVFFRAVPKFTLVYTDLYDGHTVSLPLLTRVIISLPPVLWLAVGIVPTVSIFILNQRRSSLWINLGFFIGLVLVGATGVIALLLPLVVGIGPPEN